MAKLQLKLHDLCAEAGGKKETISLSTEKEAAELFGYSYSLDNFSMKKQMYQPVEVIADIAIAKSTKNDWVPIDRSKIETIFKFRKVTLSLMSANGNDVAQEIFNDFYVHEVIPEYLQDGMNVKLRIFSLDKMLTLKQTSRSFVGKKLGSDILEKEVAKYALPYDSSKNLGCNTTFMKRLKFESLNVSKKDDKKDDKKDGAKDTKKEPKIVEHIFPYLVQYNESFYDLLVRTTNRWGEFMYYEDGKLQIGYNDAQDAVKTVDKFYKITYSNKDTSESLLSKVKDGKFEVEAAYDKTVYDTPVPKSPRLVRAELGKFNGQGDKYAMRTVASFFNTDQNVTSWTLGRLTDDGASMLLATNRTRVMNNAQNEKYFPGKGTDEQYGKYTFTLYDKETESKDGFNEFTEITSAYANKDDIYDAKRYEKTFGLEQKAGRNMVFIDYDTTWPGLKLGNIIQVNGERFIVVDISAAYKGNQLTFKVQGSGAYQYKKDNKTYYDFYPAVIASGHVRYSGPQMAKIKDASDPTFKNRVRVVFPWQDNADVKDATPWVPFAAKGDGKTSTGKHNKDDEVLVGFIDGNIERPYVIGATQTKVPDDPTINVDFDTPGGHHMRLTDGSGGGMANFVASAFSPAVGTLFNLVPVNRIPGLGALLKDDKVWSKNKYFEGGFTMSDYYGIYKISGSTDKRNVTISSPWGDVKMDAFTGITISAPNGDVKIKGKNVTIEAGNNLKLESGTNIGWKLFSDKKFGNYSAASLGLTVSSAIASKVAEKAKLLDLSIVRSVVEVVMRPVEGALTVRSNRFLKLEAGKSTCEYPTLAYNLDVKKKLIAEGKIEEIKKVAAKTSDGVKELFQKIPSLVQAMVENWTILYNDCYSKKMVFEAAVDWLNVYRNDKTKPSCKSFDQLKDTLWASGDKAITEADLGFAENVSDNKLSDECILAHSEVDDADEILEERKKAKTTVFQAANDLRKAIVKVLKFEMTEKDIDSVLGSFRWTSAPKDSKKKLLDAISKSKCNKFVMYDGTAIDKTLSEPVRRVGNLTIRTYKRFACLNLIEGMELDQKRANAENSQQPPEKPTIDNIMDDSVWVAFINSLKAVPELKSEDVPSPSLGGALKDAFVKPIKEGVAAMNLKNAYQEKCSWSDGNNGQILFGTGNNTYSVDGRGNNATMNKIETIQPLIKVGNFASVDEITTFLKNIKEVLRDI